MQEKCVFLVGDLLQTPIYGEFVPENLMQNKRFNNHQVGINISNFDEQPISGIIMNKQLALTRKLSVFAKNGNQTTPAELADGEKIVTLFRKLCEKKTFSLLG